MKQGEPVEWDGMGKDDYHTGHVEDLITRPKGVIVRWTMVEGKRRENYSMLFTRRKDGQYLPLGKRKAPSLVRM